MAKERIQDYARVKFKRIVLFFSVAILLALLIVATRSAYVQDVLRTLLMEIEDLGWWGPVAFVATYNLATVLFVPGSVLTLGGGAIFGLWWGSVYVFAASSLGAVFAFAIGRYLCRDRVVKYMESHPKFKALDRAVSQQGLKIVFLTRLCPLFPFNLLNYALGITQVSLKDYVLGSLGMIPGTIMYVYSGSLVGEVAAIGAICQSTSPHTEAAKWAINILGFIATVTVTVFVTRIASKALEESI
ncbi:TVP38/TMEM64 family protein [Microcoleus sp. K5-D4]|uniref:TVP38/TMEM64 family protein n=1 Tax=Microcoleus sp. K5-D4 TaxID=2818801 RepID=UPI002FD0D16C